MKQFYNKHKLAIIAIVLGVSLVGVGVKAAFNALDGLTKEDINLQVAEAEQSVAEAKLKTLLANISALGVGEGILGTGLTMNTNTNSYTDAEDLRQNVQALAERMAGLTQYQVLQVDSAGEMEAVSYPENQVSGGTDLSTTTMGTATTLTQSLLSSYNFFSVSPNVVADMTFTLPASSTLTSLIPNTGDRKTITFDNTTTTIQTDIAFANGVGTYLLYSSSTPRVMASSTGEITLIRRADTNVLVEFQSFSNN